MITTLYQMPNLYFICFIPRAKWYAMSFLQQEGTKTGVRGYVRKT